MEVARAVGLLGLAGLAEIGSGWLAWRWVRDRAGWIVGLLGTAVLVAYGVVPALRREGPLGRVDALYGGAFVGLSLLWGWWLDGDRPDRWDLLGALVVSVGIGIAVLGLRAA